MSETVADASSFLNQMKTLVREACQYEWVQPSPTGRCPHCHSGKTKVVLERVNVLPRV